MNARCYNTVLLLQVECTFSKDYPFGCSFDTYHFTEYSRRLGRRCGSCVNGRQTLTTTAWLVSGGWYKFPTQVIFILRQCFLCSTLCTSLDVGDIYLFRLQNLHKYLKVSKSRTVVLGRWSDKPRIELPPFDNRLGC
jgi:hypothetical protein